MKISLFLHSFQKRISALKLEQAVFETGLEKTLRAEEVELEAVAM